MKTDEFVALLAKDAAERHFMAALGWGLFGTTLAMAAIMGARVRE